MNMAVQWNLRIKDTLGTQPLSLSEVVKGRAWRSVLCREVVPFSEGRFHCSCYIHTYIHIYTYTYILTYIQCVIIVRG